MTDHQLHPSKSIPESDGTNLITWTISVEEVAFQENLSAYILSEPEQLTDVTPLNRNLHQRSKERMLLIMSISKDVTARLTTDELRASPYKFYNKV